MYLTLPVPVTKRIQHKVLFIPRSGVRYEVELSVPKEISFKGVKSLIGGWFDVDPATVHSLVYNPNPPYPFSHPFTPFNPFLVSC